MPFSPSDISGLKVWLKADVGAGSSNNDPVGTWSDQSGGGHDFTQSNGSNKPTFKTNIRNGLPVVRFADSTAQSLDGGDLSALFSSGASVFAAANGTNGVNHQMIYEHQNQDSWWQFGGAGYFGTFRNGRLSNTPSSGFSNGWHVWSLTAASGGAYKVWFDGTNMINQASGWTFQAGNAHIIGRNRQNSETDNQDIGEIIVYDSALNDTDRGLVEQYLNDRWIAASANATPSATAGAGAVPAPTGSGSSVTTPSAVAGIGAVPAPTTKGNGNGLPLSTQGSADIWAVTAMGQGNALPGVVAGIGAVPPATAFAIAAGTAAPATTAGIGAVPSPTVTGVAFASPSTTAGVGTVPAPTGTGIAQASPSEVAGIGAVPAATAAGVINATALPDNVISIGRVPRAHAKGQGTGGGGGTSNGVTDFWTIKALG